jgi:winged helix DNA-binding protein
MLWPMVRTGSTEWLAQQRMRTLGLWGRGAASTGAAVGRLVAMQGQEHAYARWSVAQRTAGAVGAGAVDADFDAGRILRTHVLRPTWHYVAPDDLGWLIALSGPIVDGRNARRYRELGLDPATLRTAADVMAGAVAAGPRTRHGLGAELERRGIAVTGQRLPYLLMYAELRAVLCSGPMVGRHHTYAPFEERVPRNVAREPDDAATELARRYFVSRGPALLDDFVWWSGLDAARARRALEQARPHLVSHTVDDRTYWFAEAGRRASPARPRVDLVQCYDEIVISYRASRDVLQTGSRSFAVPQHVAGFVHVLLLDGRLLGHWRPVRDRDGVRVETRVDGSVDRELAAAIAAATERYRRFAVS